MSCGHHVSVELSCLITTVRLDGGQWSSVQCTSKLRPLEAPLSTSCLLLFAVHLNLSRHVSVVSPLYCHIHVWSCCTTSILTPTLPSDPLLRNQPCVCSVASWAAIQSHEQSCKFSSAALRGTKHEDADGVSFRLARWWSCQYPHPHPHPSLLHPSRTGFAFTHRPAQMHVGHRTVSIWYDELPDPDGLCCGYFFFWFVLDSLCLWHLWWNWCCSVFKFTLFRRVEFSSSECMSGCARM